jgi:hypothetical protein
MAVSDNVETGDSYYIAEIKSLKRVIGGLNKNVLKLLSISHLSFEKHYLKHYKNKKFVLKHLEERG